MTKLIRCWRSAVNNSQLCYDDHHKDYLNKFHNDHAVVSHPSILSDRPDKDLIYMY